MADGMPRGRDPAPRKNSLQLAKVHGETTPYGFQHLLGRALWSPAVAQQALSAYVMEHLGATDRGRDGVPEEGSPFGLGGGDCVSGHSSQLQHKLEEQGQAYVLAGPANEPVLFGFRQVLAQDLVAELPAEVWQPRACGLGARGPRVYDWQCHPMAAPAGQPRGRKLLCRSSRDDPTRSQAFKQSRGLRSA